MSRAGARARTRPDRQPQEHKPGCPHHPERWARVAPGDRKHVNCTCAWEAANGRA